MKLWRNAGGYDPAAQSALPWLLVVARHRALDQLRSASSRREAPSTEAELDLAAAGCGLEPAAEDRIWERQALERIRGVLPRLTPEQRRVVEMAYFDGYSQSEISEKIGAPLGTVKTWTRSGLAKLRAALS